MNTQPLGLDERLWPVYLAEMMDQPSDQVPDLRAVARPDYRPAWHVVPDRGNTAVIGAGKFRAQVTVPVGTYLWGLGAYSASPDGFLCQITDLGTGTPLFNAPISWKAITGQAAVSGITFPLFIFHRPRLVIEPGLLSVEVQNNSASSNEIQLVLLAAQPRA